MADSLVIANLIELLGGGAPSTNAQCFGAQFRLAPGFNLSAPQPQQDIVANLILDGERPQGRRSGNRTITLPIVIQAPNRAILAGARELLLATIDAQEWSLVWTRDPGSGTPLPTVFDCYRALPTVVTYSMAYERACVSLVQVSFQAQPYARSNTQQSLSFSSAATGSTPPPSPVTIDSYSSVSGTNFTQSTQHVVGPNSAHWASNGGNNGVPFYTKTGLSLDISNRPALSLYIGLGVSGFNYYNWRAGNVNFTLTITDNSGHSQSVSAAQYLSASNNASVPNWQLISINIPSQAGFDYTHITGYTFTCYNFQYFGTSMTVDTYLDDLVANPVTTGVAASSRGQIYNLFGVKGSARAPLNLQVQQAPVSNVIAVPFTTAGAANWTPPAGVTTYQAEKWAGGAPGGSRTTAGQATGGKGGEYAKDTGLACTPGVPVSLFVGAAGVPSATAPTDGGDTWVGANDSTAAHGAVAPAVNTTAASNVAHGVSTSAVHFAGGSPAAASTTGGGGGESGGPSGAGNAAVGQAGGTGNANAGDGGAGGAAGNNAGAAGVAPGGGGGGASSTGGTVLGGAGAAGKVIITYIQVLVPFKTLIAHLPSPDAPQDLCPFVSVGNGADTPNGLTEYAVPSLVANTLADFDGTYSFILTNFSWASGGTTARTVTVTINQYEYAGGPSYSQSLIRTLTPSTDVVNGIVNMGELTLPYKDVSPDNTTGFYTVTVTSTQTTDRFLDCLFLDTQGQTVVISASAGYPNMWIDEPTTSRDVGRVLGSAFDRASSISILDQCNLSGGPLTVYPGDNTLLLYCIEGAPAAVASYSPRWQNDRLS